MEGRVDPGEYLLVVLVVRFQPLGQLPDEFEGPAGVVVLHGHDEASRSENRSAMRRCCIIRSLGEMRERWLVSNPRYRREDDGRSGQHDPKNERCQGVRYLKGEEALQPSPH